MDLNVAEEMFTFAVGKQLISPPKMFPWQRKFNPPPTSSKLISSFFGGTTETDPLSFLNNIIMYYESKAIVHRKKNTFMKSFLVV